MILSKVESIDSNKIELMPENFRDRYKQQLFDTEPVISKSSTFISDLV